jgi:hypothetical protein
MDTSSGRVYFDQAADGTGLLTFHDGTEYYTSNGTDLTKQADTEIPTPVAGNVVLDQYQFLMNNLGSIHNSVVGDVTDWAGDSINAELQSDVGVGIARYINYIIAFGEKTIEFFYDAANTTGSPLTRSEGQGILTGCAGGATITNCEQELYFVAQAPDGGRFVGAFKGGFGLERVSTTAIDEYLEKEKANISNAYGFYVRKSGKRHFVLTLPTTAKKTFALDLDSNIWVEWTSDVSDTETYFTGVDATVKDGAVYILDEDNGQIYELDSETYQDNTGSAESIKVQIDTAKFDFATTQNKFLWFLKWIGDFAATTTTVGVSWSDDDYQTFSTARNFDINIVGEFMNRCGSYQRRSFRITHTANTALRAQALEGEQTTGHYAR